MFERFTERARQVVVLAQEESRALQHGYIGTEHVLMGLLREEEALAARVLEQEAVTIEKVREYAVKIIGRGDESVSGQLPFTPRAKKVLELALREALSLGHSYIGTEHILLGLVRENEGVAARILLELGTDQNKIRERTINLLTPAKRDEETNGHQEEEDDQDHQEWMVEITFCSRDDSFTIGPFVKKPVITNLGHTLLVAVTGADEEEFAAFDPNQILLVRIYKSQ